MLFSPETKDLNLEEVGGVFGNVVVSTEKEAKTKAEEHSQDSLEGYRKRRFEAIGSWDRQPA